MQTVKGKLVFKDGSFYEGELLGNRNAVGEVVFTTGMSGYQETLTDPSFLWPNSCFNLSTSWKLWSFRFFQSIR